MRRNTLSILICSICFIILSSQADAAVTGTSVVNCNTTPTVLTSSTFDTNSSKLHHMFMNVEHYKLNDNGSLVEDHQLSAPVRYTSQQILQDTQHSEPGDNWRIRAYHFWYDCGPGEGYEVKDFKTEDLNGCAN